MALRKYLSRVRDAHDRFGTFGLLAVVVRHVRFRLSRLRGVKSPAPADSGPAFDQAFGIETCRWALLSDLSLDSANRQLCNDYQPVKPKVLATIFRRLALDPSRYTFIDYGSGKGRALVLAAEHGFSRIVGVEFSAELCDIARKNILRYRSVSGSTAAISVVCSDATVFEVPAGDCVLYFYNPFQAEILGRVLQNVKIAMEAQDRQIVIIYHNPQFRKVLDNADFLEKIAGDVWSEEWYLVYQGKRDQKRLREKVNGAGAAHQNA